MNQAGSEARTHSLVRYAEAAGGIALLIGLYVISRQNYLLFHGIAEVFSSVVALAIFALAWNSRSYTDNDYLLFIGIGYLFVGGIDLVHMLAYKGMGVFPTYGTNLPTQLWIVARYLEALTLLIAPFFLRWRVRTAIVIPAYIAVVTAALTTIFLRVFPACFVDGVGLTPFKKVSEYVISAIILGAIFELVRRRQEMDKQVFQLITVSMVLTIASEMSFTLYVDPYGFFNLLGHFLKIVSFYLIYRAIIETGLKRPFSLLLRDLKRNEEVLEAQREELETYAHTVSHDLQGGLTVIRGFAQAAGQALKAGEMETVDYCLEQLVKAENRMGMFIRSLLDYASSGSKEGAVEIVEPALVLEEALQEIEGLNGGERFDIRKDDAMPAVLVDPLKLKQAFYNLIGNAVKYMGESPQPVIEISAESSGRWCTFRVRDNGPGIEPDLVGKVFEPFQRGYGGSRGIGVGLSTVKRAVEGWGGRVWVESRVGEGSTFYFTAPLA